MRMQYQWWHGLVAAVLGGLVGVTAVAVAGEQFLAVLSIREGALRSFQAPRADGYIAYLTLLNERDGGINGIKLVWEECETVYDVDRAVECYERLKTRGATGAAAVAPIGGTPIVNALIERATHDQIPLITLGLGRADATDGRVFPYVFNAPTNWWSQNTAKLRFIGQRAGGMAQLKGLKIAHVYLDNDYGRETIPILDHQAAHYGFVVQHLSVQWPGLDQKATWLRVKVAQPDWVILRTAGVSTSTALQEAAQIGFPRDKIVGSTTTCAKQDMLPARGAARGFICTTRYGTGAHFPLIQDILRYVYARGKGAGPERDVGTEPWKEGVLRGLLTAEGLRTAMRHFGHQPLTGSQVQWGLEHLTFTAASLKELGAEGLFPPLTLSCRDHEGGGCEVPAVGRTTVDRDHRLDRHGSGAGAAAGGGVGGQICAGEGHYAAGLPVGAWLLRQGAKESFLRTRVAPNKVLEGDLVKRWRAFLGASRLAFGMTSTGVERRYASDSGHWQNSG